MNKIKSLILSMPIHVIIILQVTTLILLFTLVILHFVFIGTTLSSFTIGNMSDNIFYTLIFIIFGLSSILDAIRVLVDPRWTKTLITKVPFTHQWFWGRILGADRAAKLYKSTIPFGIILGIGSILFGLILLFL